MWCSILNRHAWCGVMKTGGQLALTHMSPCVVSKCRRHALCSSSRAAEAHMAIAQPDTTTRSCRRCMCLCLCFPSVTSQHQGIQTWHAVISKSSSQSSSHRWLGQLKSVNDRQPSSCRFSAAGAQAGDGERTFGVVALQALILGHQVFNAAQREFCSILPASVFFAFT